MLRKKLFLAMLPVFLVLTATSLYTLYSQNRETEGYKLALERNYGLIASLESIASAANQLERGIRLGNDGEIEASERILTRSTQKLDTALDRLNALKPDNYSESLPKLKNHILKIRDLDSAASLQRTELGELVEEIDSFVFELTEDELRKVISRAEGAKRTQSRITLTTLAFVLASLALLAATIFVISKRILGPIDELTAQANEISDDTDWQSQHQTKADGELAILVDAFSNMAKRIQAFKSSASQDLQKARKRTEDCLNGYPHPVIFFDREKRVLYRNPSAKELDPQAVWNDKLPKTVEAAVNKVIHKGEDHFPTEFDETITLNVSTSKRHFLPIGFEIEGDASDSTECALVLQDITELQLSDQLKSDMVATVSHELKTPVTSVSIALHMLEEQHIGELNELQLELTQTALADLDRLMRTLEHLLQIARLEAHAPRLKREHVQTGEVIQSTIETHSLTAGEKQISFEARLEPQLPPFIADRKAIDIALSNFLSNAIKYSPRNSTVTLYAKKSEDGKRLVLGTLDQGPGIPEDEIDRAFDKFYRSSRQSEQDGIGLGLSIVKDIAIAHQGKAGCRLNETGGCDFYIEIPLS